MDTEIWDTLTTSIAAIRRESLATPRTIYSMLQHFLMLVVLASIPFYCSIMSWLVVHHMSSVHEVSDVLMAIAPLYPSRRHDRTGFHAGKKWGKTQINMFFENHDKNGTSVLLWMVTPVRAVRNAASTIQLANFQAGGCWVFFAASKLSKQSKREPVPKVWHQYWMVRKHRRPPRVPILLSRSLGARFAR